MLLDVAENHMAEIHESTFPGYHKWRISSPRDVGDHDQAFVNELLGMAIDILGRVMRQQLLSSEIGNAVSEQKPQPTAHSSSAHHDTFTLFPRKVKVGQNKIIIILVEHLMKDDWIKIKIEMSNETIEITNVKRRNPYTIQFNIPDACLEISMMIGVRVEKNNIDLGCRPLKCESRLRELEQILKSQTSPVEFLCQSVGIASADRDRLDSLLLQSFQKNVPTNFHLLNSVESASGLKSRRESRHGQDEVDLAIDKKKQAEKDKEILNNLNSDIDHDAREQEILFNELKITEPMYFESSDVNKSDAFSQECSNLLESCNASDVNDFDYLVQPSNLPVRKIDTVESDYLVQPSNIPVHEYTNLEIGRDWHDVQEAGRDLSHLRLSFKKKDSESSGTSKDRGLQRQESNTSKKSVDDELLEIIADFKNNVFTIQEVESLVESWKSRNDVQKCFKDKQEQLQKMREEYERIQQQMKEKLKRPTPFERMKKMFSRNKSTTNTKDTQSSSGPSDICEDIKFSMMPSTSQSNRPNSSSSLHSISSNSSGISSSNSSEERKCVTKVRAGSSMEDYMIPPSPRPLNPVLENRPISNAHDSDEHYTAFPSNVPVAVQQQMSDYVNTSAMLNSIDENNETETILQSINVQRQNVSYSQLDIVRPSMSSFK
ncbi:stumps [Culex quinquefasciatus]|uniref:Stumps n=1 Tax=Culex quinquefasciatus TaxID=7176 RepID=B0X718_CULQU|nr:stumps [Culex quinquefasciatus]|eukprot:XP_001865440.1 stumps [Culex quinquefasciatus]